MTKHLHFISLTKSLWQTLKFSGITWLLVGVEFCDFWTGLGVRPFLLLLLLYVSLIYSLPFIGIPSLVTIGLFQDSLYHYPLGFWSCQYLILYLFLIYQHKNRLVSNLIFSWGYFLIFLLFAVVLQSLGWYYLTHQSVPVLRIMPDFLFTLSLYPLFTWAIFRLSRKLMLRAEKR